MDKECLLHKHEDLNLNPQNPCKNLGMVMCTSNPSTGGGEPGTGGSLESAGS